MSDLDQFTINYKIQVNAAIQNLQKLNTATAKTNQGLNKSTKMMSQFTQGASAALGQLVPQFNGIGTAVRVMNSEFAAAAAGVGVLTAAVGLLIKTRNDYNQQRKESFDLGFSSTRLEDYQRKFVLNSKGQISREQTASNLQRLQENTWAAYTDPLQFNQQAKTLQLLGFSRDRSKGPPEMTAVIGKLATVLSKFTEEQARGIGRTMGLDPDFVMSLRKQGAGINNVGMSAEEINNRMQAEKSLDEFNQQMATLTEKLLELGHAIGVELLPGFIKFVEWVQTLAGSTKDIHKREEENARTQWIQQRRDAITKEYYENQKKNGGRGIWQGIKDTFSGSQQNLSELAESQATNEWEAAHAKSDSATQTDPNKAVSDEDKKNAEARKVAMDMQLAINMFAQSVATFANAIDEREAWAAWAGQIGAANGLSGPGAATPGGIGKDASPSVVGLPNSYDKLFEASAKKYGVDSSILKNIARVESSFRPGADNGTAGGLMGLNYAYNKQRGLDMTTVFDPARNIDAGAKVWSEMLKLANGDVTLALRYYNGGLDRSKWGKQNAAYAGKVLGGSTQGIGVQDIQKLGLERNIANSLGLKDVKQLQMGGVNRGDVAFTLSQFQAGLNNNMFNLNRDLNKTGLSRADRSKIMSEIRSTQMGLNNIDKYGASIVGNSRDTNERTITEGARPILTVNINGTYDPKVIEHIVRGELQQHFGDLSNSNSTARVQ